MLVMPGLVCFKPVHPDSHTSSFKQGLQILNDITSMHEAHRILPTLLWDLRTCRALRLPPKSPLVLVPTKSTILELASINICLT